MIRLVVNAEEFGATSASDRDILQAHRGGVVSSTALLGNSRELAVACASLAEVPALGVGMSLALFGGEAIAHPQSSVSTLLTGDGTLRSSPTAFLVDWLRNVISPEQVEIEMNAQVARARDAGLTLDHLCTRGHLGFLPGVGRIVERVARRHQIAGIRSTVEPPMLGWLTDPRRGLETSVLAGLSWLSRRQLGALRHGPRTWGYLESGHLDEVRILEIVGRLTPGAHELICHPAGAAGRTDGFGELGALTSTKVRTALERRGILVCRWQDLF